MDEPLKQSQTCRKAATSSSSSLSASSSCRRSNVLPSSTGRRRYKSLSADNQKFVDQLVCNILRESFLIHSTREKYVSNIPARRRRETRTRRRASEAVKGGGTRVRSQSEYRGRRTLFATPDFTPQLRTSHRCLYVSMHDLPDTASFSYKDDTIGDSLEDLIANKVKQIQTQNADPQPPSDAAVGVSLDFLKDPSSPIRSEKGRERIQFDSDYDDPYDDYFNRFPAFSEQRADQEKELKRSFSFTQRIIRSNLKHHQPDDLDVESLTISVKKSVRAIKSNDNTELSVRNLPLFLTSLNLSRNTLL